MGRFRTTTVCHHYFINNVIGTYIDGLAKFFKNSLFDRTTEIVVGTYEKAVQHYTQRIQNLGETHHPVYPFATLDPSLDFEPEEIGGRFLYQYPQFEPNVAIKEFQPRIYEDDNVIVAPILNRYKGRLELIIWCSSVYEYMDNRLLAYQFFGGLNRVISPTNIEGYFILPDEVVFYDYTNAYTNESYTLDWDNTTVENVLVKNINQNKYTFPFAVQPQIRLVGVSDGSEKYGGDDLAEWRLSLEIEWETVLPTHLIMETTHLPERSHIKAFEIDVGFVYVAATEDEGEETSPEEIMLSIYDTSTEEFTRIDAHYDNTFNYFLTESDITAIDNDEDIDIDLGDVNISNSVYLQVFGKYGRMEESYHWELKDYHTITLKGVGLTNLDEDDLITVIKYIDD
jgi:hypothetical protein